MPALLTRMSTEPSRSTQVSIDVPRHARRRDVGLQVLVADALGLDQLARGAVVVHDARHEHVGAALGERQREGLAEAGVAARDDGLLAREREEVHREIPDLQGLSFDGPPCRPLCSIARPLRCGGRFPRRDPCRTAYRSRRPRPKGDGRCRSFRARACTTSRSAEPTGRRRSTSGRACSGCRSCSSSPTSTTRGRATSTSIRATAG